MHYFKCILWISFHRGLIFTSPVFIILIATSKFVNAISSAKVSCQALNVNYASPSIGKVTFGWESPFTVKGKEQELRWKYRYDNPYCKAMFNSRKIEIKKGSEKLILDSTKL